MLLFIQWISAKHSTFPTSQAFIYLDNLKFHLYKEKNTVTILSSGTAHELHCVWICKSFLILVETDFLCLIQSK